MLRRALRRQYDRQRAFGAHRAAEGGTGHQSAAGDHDEHECVADGASYRHRGSFRGGIHLPPADHRPHPPLGRIAGYSFVGRHVCRIPYESVSDFLRVSEREWYKKHKEGWENLFCHFCCLYWAEIRQYELVDVDAGFPVTILVEQAYGNDIEAVIEEYQVGLEQNFGTFREINNEFPKGLDKRYRMFFEEVFEEDEDEITTVEEWGRMREKELKERKS